ncbi:MAG TPA: globin domain-containing protein [Burkholderiales bacterium]|jgi:hemoglobin-like flavoprotein|nr:globin domain-containing protein [Burkholderiales bacterium]
MTPDEVHVVQTTWRAVLPVGGTFAELFYGRLFALDPELKKLFRDDIVEQGRNLTAMLSVAAANVGKPERISVALRNLGKRHVAYGVKPKDFANFEDALLFALEHALIDVFTPEVKAAWRAAYALLTGMMLEVFTPSAIPAGS